MLRLLSAGSVWSSLAGDSVGSGAVESLGVRAVSADLGVSCVDLGVSWVDRGVSWVDLGVSCADLGDSIGLGDTAVGCGDSISGLVVDLEDSNLGLLETLFGSCCDNSGDLGVS